MSSRSFALLNQLSHETQRPIEVGLAMHQYLISNLKLTKRNLTVNRLKTLWKNKIGTNEAMIHANNISKHFVRRNGYNRSVQYIMKEKILDAECEERYIRNKFLKCKRSYHEVIKKNSIVDIIFNRIMRYEVEKVWSEGKVNKNYYCS